MKIEDIVLLLHRPDAEETALTQFMKDQQDRTSPRYHKWLTAKQFGKRFGLAKSDTDAIVSWRSSSHGFNVHPLAAGGRTISFDAAPPDSCVRRSATPRSTCSRTPATTPT